MIRALVVEDEKLIRKGMISVMPWVEYGIRVVGDVNCGEKALGFLEDNHVELVITDLVMPGMSGIDLMRNIKSNFPDIWIVVLTSHMDFQYVQEALRLGAIDYIIKTEIEKEKMGDILERIVSRMGLGKQRTTAAILGSREPVAMFTGGVLVLDTCFDGVKENANINGLMRYHDVYWVDAYSWFIPFYDEESKENEAVYLNRIPNNRYIYVKISGFDKADWKSVVRFLEFTKNCYIFYEYKVGKQLYDIDRCLVSEAQMELQHDEFQYLRNIWQSFDWINCDDGFNKILMETDRIRPEAAKLSALAYSAASEWERFISCLDIKIDIMPPREFQFWTNVVSWLKETRTLIREKIHKPLYSEDITYSIMKAVEYFRMSNNDHMTQEQISRHVGMSRSYFSQCFRDISGKSFNKFIIEMKIKKAELLLETTDYPIYWIAEKAGYRDDKHFSRVFQKNTGMLPSEYRNAKKTKYKRIE